MPLPTSSTEAEYLALDRDSDLKHEFIGGRVVAMSGASRAHNLIVTNTILELHRGADLSGCEVYPNDMRVHYPGTRFYGYPDLRCFRPPPSRMIVATKRSPTGRSPR